MRAAANRADRKPPLTYQQRTLRLQTPPEYRQRLPFEVCGRVMTQVGPLVRGSLRMAIEGASVAQGGCPGWLQRASDIRFVDYGHDGNDTLIEVALPSLGEAAEEIYRQQRFWDTRPDPAQTGIEVFRRVVEEVASENGESEWFDRALLNKVTSLTRVFGPELSSLSLPGKRQFALTQSVVRKASHLNAVTPPSRQVRVTGVLDMVRHSTRSFGLMLDSDEEVRGVTESAGAADLLREWLGRRVLVLGRAVYRPSGRLLRLDAAAIEDGTGSPVLFSKLPPSQGINHVRATRKNPSEIGKTGVAAFFGTWPGEETDQELLAMLDELRHGPVAAR